MRIVHVVSALSPDNRFGGPSRVAVDLARELQTRGHQVVVIAAAVGYRRLPQQIDGVPVELARSFNPTPFLGWASLLAPALASILRRRLRGADIVHVHLARDVVTLTGSTAALWARKPLVVQTHGMIDAAGGSLARMLDAGVTARVIRKARAALVLTGAEQVELTAFGLAAACIQRFPNGVDAAPVAAAQGDRHRAVLFLARLHPRKGAAAFAAAAVAVADRHPDQRFLIVGPDEGDGPAVARILDASARSVQGRIERRHGVPAAEARQLSAQCLVSVLPAEGEPFGMTIVEAMAAGRPVIVAASAELAPEIRRVGAGWTVGEGGQFPDLETALDEVLAAPDEIERAGAAAAVLVEDRYRIAAVVDRLEMIYERIVSGDAP